MGTAREAEVTGRWAPRRATTTTRDTTREPEGAASSRVTSRCPHTDEETSAVAVGKDALPARGGTGRTGQGAEGAGGEEAAAAREP